MSKGDQNIMVILSSPSGVGKTTITKKFSKNTARLKFLFHTQLEQPRSNEVDGVDYNFVSNKEFKEVNKQKKILRTC